MQSILDIESIYQKLIQLPEPTPKESFSTVKPSFSPDNLLNQTLNPYSTEFYLSSVFIKGN
jgi:hypothetical protein